MRSLLVLLLCTVFNSALAAPLPESLVQGGLIIAKAEKHQRVFVDDRELTLSPQGFYVFGVGRDAGPKVTVKIVEQQQTVRSKDIEIIQRDYDIQRIDGLASSMVTPPKAVLSRIKDDNYRVAMARRTESTEQGFLQPFIWPAEGRLSGIYGSQRVLNGVPKRPHYGLDVAAPVGTPVVSPSDGVVTLADDDMYYSGGTLIVDHGFGISSTFIHLDKIHVVVGQRVKQGQRIADVGVTGRVTGAHLDWRVNWFSERLDPQLLVPKRQ